MIGSFTGEDLLGFSSPTLALACFCSSPGLFCVEYCLVFTKGCGWWPEKCRCLVFDDSFEHEIQRQTYMRRMRPAADEAEHRSAAPGFHQGPLRATSRESPRPPSPPSPAWRKKREQGAREPASPRQEGTGHSSVRSCCYWTCGIRMQMRISGLPASW